MLHTDVQKSNPEIMIVAHRLVPLSLLPKAMAAKKVNLPANNFYALEVSRKLGLGDAGALRAGLAPYTTHADVDRLVAGLAELVGK